MQVILHKYICATSRCHIWFRRQKQQLHFYILIRDSRDNVIGVVIIHRDADELERVVAYGAATLDATQRNYSTTERECLAIVYTCDGIGTIYLDDR